MLIKVLKNTLASANNLGNSLKEYEAGKIYDIYEELANTFVREEWGEYVEKIELETQEENLRLETQDLKLGTIGALNRVFNTIKDFPRKKKNNVND